MSEIRKTAEEQAVKGAKKGKEKDRNLHEVRKRSEK